jgi:hypothetical protein
MLRSMASKVAWVGRTASMVFGLALVLALIFGVASVALSATGGNFILGKANEATTVSKLTASVAGPALTLVNQSTDAAATALNISVASGKAPLRVNAAAGTATNLSADELDGKDASNFYGQGSKVVDSAHADQADSATSASSAADADTLEGKDSSDFQPSNPCPSGTLFHEGACVETAKRGTAAFPNAEAVCLQAGRRLPTVAELQTFRLRGGQDFDTAEYTSQAWTDADGSTRPNVAMLVNPSGTQTPTSVFAGAAFRCVAAPNVDPPGDAREAAAQSDLRDAAAATACAAANDGSYVECGTEAQLSSYGFDKSPDVTYVNLTATESRWVSATQHNDGGSAYQFDTATGGIQPIPRF